MADRGSTRPAKLQRLNNLRRSVPHVSQSALSAILEDVNRNGVPDLINRNAIHESREAAVDMDTPFGKLHQVLELEPARGTKKIHLSVIHPLGLLWVLCSTCACFSCYMEQVMLALPPTFDNPWALILYSDEVTPGNPLATKTIVKYRLCIGVFSSLGNTYATKSYGSQSP